MILITLRRALLERQTPHHRALDAAFMVLCLRYGRDRLPDGLPNLRARFLKMNYRFTLANAIS
jgi:hypothetical protein